MNYSNLMVATARQLHMELHQQNIPAKHLYFNAKVKLFGEAVKIIAVQLINSSDVLIKYMRERDNETKSTVISQSFNLEVIRWNDTNLLSESVSKLLKK